MQKMQKNWKKFVYKSTYFGSHPERGCGDETKIFLFHPSVQLEQWVGISFSHGTARGDEKYEAFERWLEGLSEDNFVLVSEDTDTEDMSRWEREFENS